MPVRIVTILIAFAYICSAIDANFFESRVRPVLAGKCYSCHGADKQFGNLRLDSRDRILRGGTSGPAAVAGKPGESLLIRAVRHDGRRMPPDGKLPAQEIAALENWIEKGLQWPESKAGPLATGDPGYYDKLIREHWAFQPLRNPAAPQGRGNAIDQFISEKLRASGLNMAPPADGRVLARRVAFVLTGLPPTREQVRSFAEDADPDAYQRYIDSLLASPHFGERWARHWMDVVRFAETYGYEWNFEINGAWRYRDYLIRAFNSDLPYDQFIREHIAGDLLTKPRTRDHGKWNESVLATAFYRLGEMGHDNCDQFPEIRTDVVDNQIDTLTKAFQGVTVSCARCHDHKIDPIPTEDYYALYGVLNSSRPVTRTLDLVGPDATTRERLADLKLRIRTAIASEWLKETGALGRQLAAAIAWEIDAPDATANVQSVEIPRIAQLRQLLRRADPDMSDPLYPALEWMRQPGEAEWRNIVGRYADETAIRERFNSEKFAVFADFRTALPAGWTADGWGYRTGRAKDGDFALAMEGGDALAGIFPAGIFTHLLSDRLNGVIRSPLLPRDKRFLTMQISGSRLGAYRLVLDHCVIGEDHEIIKSPKLSWVRTSSKADRSLPVYLELSTVSDNPRFPERPEKFRNLTEEQFASPRSSWGITRILLHDEEVEPKLELRHISRLLVEPAPRNIQQLAAAYERIIQDAIRSWRDTKSSSDDVVWLDWLMQNGLVTNSRNLTPEIRALTDEYRNVEKAVADPAIVYSMADVDPGRDYPILLGGQSRSPGRPAPRHFLTLMPEPLRAVSSEQSGRRELAEAIASDANPLTARVMVNRMWHHVFGRGIVATTDDFGGYGEAPTHPELLDYLAARFVTDGWSIKKLLRLMLLSDTFRQSSYPQARAEEADPQNLLWHRYPIRRLEAESVRDSILAVSGSLNSTQFGPGIPPYRTEAKPYRRLFQGPLDGDGRRSIYLKVTRMEGPRFLETFDFPPPLQTRGNRDVTNVASQSLALLNDPFVTAQSRAWAKRLIKQSDLSVDVRLSRMFESALGRTPNGEELSAIRVLVQTLARRKSVDPSDTLGNDAIWRDVAHTFFNMKEFLYVR